VKITWLGHACFRIEADGKTIITDPFNEDVPYDFPDTSADLVTVSHSHFDHNAVHRVTGDPAVLETVGSFRILGTPVTGIASYHDKHRGAERGENILYVFDIEGLRIAHLGDLGTNLTEAQRTALSGVEILLIPVGGHFTIDPATAAQIVRSLPSVKAVIPMHFKTGRIADWPIETVEPFAQMMDNTRHIGSAEVSVKKETLPQLTEVWILDHA